MSRRVVITGASGFAGRHLAALCAEGGAVCFVTQNQTEVEHADRVGRIEEGRRLSLA